MKFEEKLKLHGVIVKSLQGGFTGYFSEIPEAIAEGETEEEVKENLFEALREVLSYKREEASSLRGNTSNSFELNLEIA